MGTIKDNNDIFCEMKPISFWRQKIDSVLEKLNSLEQKGALIGKRQDKIDSLAYNYLSRHHSIKITKLPNFQFLPKLLKSKFKNLVECFPKCLTLMNSRFEFEQPLCRFNQLY